MNSEQFSAILPYISADLAGLIAEKNGFPENEALVALYNSSLYAQLEQEETKLWHYSTQKLYALFDQECKSGHMEFPDV